MWKLGNIEIKGKVVLAPMAGITCAGYRKYLNFFGVDIAVTEMVSDMGLIYGNKETKSYVEFEKMNCPTGVQLFGNSAENIAKSAIICEKMNPNIDFYEKDYHVCCSHRRRRRRFCLLQGKQKRRNAHRL